MDPKALVRTGKAEPFTRSKKQCLVRRTLLFRDPVGDLGNLEFGIDFGLDPDQFPVLLEKL